VPIRLKRSKPRLYTVPHWRRTSIKGQPSFETIFTIIFRFVFDKPFDDNERHGRRDVTSRLNSFSLTLSLRAVAAVVAIIHFIFHSTGLATGRAMEVPHPLSRVAS
jgi:hypothetical protein